MPRSKYCFHSGIVCLNWSGSTQTISVKGNTPCWDIHAMQKPFPVPYPPHVYTSHGMALGSVRNIIVLTTVSCHSCLSRVYPPW